MVSLSTSSSVDQSKSTYCFNVLTVTFIRVISYQVTWWLELSQEPEVIFVKQSDIADAIADHGDALDAKAKSPA